MAQAAGLPGDSPVNVTFCGLLWPSATFLCYYMFMKRGIFIVLEGPDRSGKSTQASLLRTWLEGSGHKVMVTREPGGTYLSERIRRILLDPRSNIEPMTELFLYETSSSFQRTQIHK